MKPRQLREYMRRIAKLYGAKVVFENISGGYADPNGTITVGTKDSRSWFITVFCHELAHHCNQIDGKYPLYHDGSMRWLRRNRIEQSARYAYRAEQFTEKVGRELCRTWFPGVKYHTWYNGSQYTRGFTFGYYFSR